MQRLEAACDPAIALAGIERYRIWRIYMAGCAFAFERGWMSLHQVVATKPDAAGLAPRLDPPPPICARGRSDSLEGRCAGVDRDGQKSLWDTC